MKRRHARLPQPKPFLVALDLAALSWSVKQGARWRHVEHLVIQVPTETVPLVPNDLRELVAGRPVTVLQGAGVVRCVKRGRIVITG